MIDFVYANRFIMGEAVTYSWMGGEWKYAQYEGWDIEDHLRPNGYYVRLVEGEGRTIKYAGLSANGYPLRVVAENYNQNAL